MTQCHRLLAVLGGGHQSAGLVLRQPEASRDAGSDAQGEVVGDVSLTRAKARAFRAGRTSLVNTPKFPYGCRRVFPWRVQCRGR